MTEIFSRHGVRFRYPDDWELTEQPNEDGVAITVASPGTSFWILQLFYGGPSPEHVVDQAVDAFRQEYETLDFYPATAEVCHRPACAGDLEFVCLELINSAYLRAFQTADFTALVLYQGTDHELAQTRDALEAMTSSLQCDDPLP